MQCYIAILDPAREATHNNRIVQATSLKIFSYYVIDQYYIILFEIELIIQIHKAIKLVDAMHALCQDSIACIFLR